MELDFTAFETLEAKVRKAIELVKVLKSENESLRKKLDESNAALDKDVSSREDIEKYKSAELETRRELEKLKEEKETVRARVEAILDDFEELDLD